MKEWYRYVQQIVDEIDRCILAEDDEALALKTLAEKMGYSEYHMSRRFSEISGMHFGRYAEKSKRRFHTF